MIKFTLKPFVLLIALISGCSNSGGSGFSTPALFATPKVLATIQSGGATEFSLVNGKIVFSDYNRGKILSVSSDGGEIKTLYANSFSSPGKIVTANGKVFFLNTQTAGGIISMPENAIGVSTLVELTGAGWIPDISSDETYVYWSLGSNVYRTPLIVTTKVVETIYTGINGGTVRMALDGDHLYITDTDGRKLVHVNTTTLVKSEILYFSDTPFMGKFYSGMPIAIDNGHINVLTDNMYIHHIDKAKPQESIAATNYMNFDNVNIVADTTGVYWWVQTDASTLSLKKLDSASGNTTILLTMPFTWDLDAFISDGSYLYWFEHELNSVGGYLYKIKRVSITGGNSELVATYTSDINIGGALLPYVVTFDADNLYWTSSTTNIVVKLNKSGGQPEIVTRLDGYYAITAINGFVLAASKSNVIKIPIDGATPATSEWSQSSMSSSIPEEMTNDDTNLYWVVNNMGSGTDARGQFDVYSRPIGGGIAIKLTAVSGTVERIYSYADSLFLAKSQSGGGSISVIPKTGGNEIILVRTIGGEPSDLQIVGNVLYFLAGGVRTINLDTGEEKTLVQQNSTNRIYVDGVYIYWSQANYGGGGGLYRMPVGGGTAQRIYNGASWKVTGDDKNIYWATGIKILSMAK
jgi:hypothetical protein